MIRIVLFSALVLAAPPAFADVSASGPAGFTVTIVVPVAASPSQVYRSLTDRVGSWWDADHSFSGRAANLSIDVRPGGCFCESLPGGGGVRHMTVIYADSGKLLRMSGGLGPLQALAVTGTMTFTFVDTNGATRLELTYTVGGYMSGPDGIGALAKPVDAVLTGQVMRLKQFAETAR